MKSSRSKKYRIVRMFFNDHPRVIIKYGLTLNEAQRHCKDPETSSRTCTSEEGKALTAERGMWFDGFEEEM